MPLQNALQLLTKPLFKYLQKILPPMSESERQALEAGDTWWEVDLFRGAPDWQQLLTTKFSQLRADEQAFIDNQVETLCSMLDDFKIVWQEHDLPVEVWDYLKKEKFLGMIIPKEYGGLGFSALGHSTVVLKIATRSMSTAVNAMVPNSLGPAELLLQYGTTAQKDYYLPRLAVGEEIPCFGLTGSEAGSDAAGITDTGIICKGMHEGKEIIGIKLNFDKRYITLAPIATVIGLAFKLFDPDNLLGKQENIGITLALIPAKQAGIDIGKRHLPMGTAFMNGPIRGENVFIPLEWIIGGAKQIGHGWEMLMECLSIGRSISLPALSTAVAQLTYRMTGAYAYMRQQFRLSIAHFEGVETVLAKMAGFTYLIEATRRCTAAAVDRGKKPSVASAIAKYHLTELSRQIMNCAMDVHGGRGIQWGPRNYLGLGNLGIPISITVEGANILTRNLIIFGQGAMRCHPFIRDEMQALAQGDQETFDKLLWQHLRYSLRNLKELLVKSIGKRKNYQYQLTRMSAVLAFVSDITMLILGGALKRKENLSARLGDVLSHLYLAASVLKYCKDQQNSPEDLLYTDWVVQYCLQKIQQAFDEFFDNFPKRFLGACLRFVVFPFRRNYKAPSDALGKQLVSKMLEPSPFRDRLTQYCYLGKALDDPTGRMENAFKKLHVVADLEKKYHRGDELTPEEMRLCKEAEALRWDVIQVDEFEKL